MSSEKKRIQDQIDGDGFVFGLWGECPEDVPVAWGARAIVDSKSGSVGFDLLPDRQTWAGPPELRRAFSKALNSVLDRAKEECRRLRFGWTPTDDLQRDEFAEYWIELLSNHPDVFKSFEASSGRDDIDAPFDVSPSEVSAYRVFDLCRRERARLESYNEKWDRLCLLKEGDPVPDPPSHCENERDEYAGFGEDCKQEFKKVRGGWQGCTQDSDSWICDECGYYHYFVDLDDSDEEYNPPDTPILKAFAKIVGHQAPVMSSEVYQTFTLYDSGGIVIKANTNASYGYVYLIAYPRHTAGIVEAISASEHPGFEGDQSLAKPGDVFWAGSTPIPQPGDRVSLYRPDLGSATVISHCVDEEHLFLNLVLDGDFPEQWHAQNTDRYTPLPLTWISSGNEIRQINDG